MSGAFHIFTVGGIPVSVTLWYGLLLFYMSRGGDPQTSVIWACCVTLSILVHEFGHGLLARRFGLSPSIVLHGWGGLCQHEPAKSDRDDVFIVCAGPAAGLLLGLVTVVIRGVIGVANPDILASPVVEYFFRSMIFINIAWSLINLVPLWPLDGGQLFRLAMLRYKSRPADAERITHQVGLGLGVVGALAGFLLFNSLFLLILGGLLAWQNYARINAASASGPIRSKNLFGEQLLRDAEARLQAGDYREAARLCHQLRADAKISSQREGQVWEILVVASVELGEYDDAADYLAHAPDTPRVREARAKMDANGTAAPMPDQPRT